MSTIEQKSGAINGRTVATSALWRFAETAGGEISALLVFILMARLLMPADFGVIALAGFIIAGAQVVVGFGIADALVQGEPLDDTRLSSAFWCNTGIGVALMALVMIGAGPVAALFAEPELAPLLATLALLLPICGAAAVFQARLVRQMAFKALGIRTLVANLAGGVAGLCLAVYGAGAWSLVGQQLVGITVGLLALIVADGWLPRAKFNVAEARGLLRFALPTTGTHLLKFAGKKLDIALLGLFVSPTILGYYYLATRLITAVGLASYYTIFALALPVLARLSAFRAKLETAAGRALWLTAAISLPLGIGLALVADPLLPMIFGETWRAAVVPLQILAGGSIFYALGLIAGQILVAAGQPARFFRLALANTLLFLTLVGVAAPHGLAAVALAGGLANALLLPAYLLELRRTVGVQVGAMLRNQLPLCVAAAAMAAAVIVINTWSTGRVSPLTLLLFEVVGGAAVYASALWLLAADSLRVLLASLKDGSGSREQSACAR